MLALQRSAGNAAVTRLLARDMLSNALGDAPLAAPASFNVRDPLGVGDLMADETAAGRAAFAYFDAQNKGGIISISVAELVRNAGQQTFKRKDGSEAKVIDKIPADKLEEQLRGRAKYFGVTVMEHRAATDLPGMKSEMDAILANLGAIPTELTLGDEDLKVTASIFGTIKGEAKIGSAKVEGEASSEGVEGSVKVPGATLKGSVGEKGIKASLKLGELVTIDGGLNPKSDGSVGLAGRDLRRDDRQADHAGGRGEGVLEGAEDVRRERGRAGQAPRRSRAGQEARIGARGGAGRGRREGQEERGAGEEVGLAPRRGAQGRWRRRHQRRLDADLDLVIPPRFPEAFPAFAGPLGAASRCCPMELLIVGGGLAAQRCIEVLRAAGDDRPVTVVCDEPVRAL